MNILVFRVRFYPSRTIGQLYTDGTLFCFTLEDKVREVESQPVEKWKVQNETAIPAGKYRITLENSPKFGPDTITVNAVPGFSGIRVHSGNNEDNTEGCLILGYKLNEDGTIQYGTTRTAVNDLKQKIKAAIKANEEITMDIRNIK